MSVYLDSLIDQRLDQPSTDLVSRILMFGNTRDAWLREQVRSMLALLLFAGHESTRATIGNGMLALLQHPQAMERLRAEPVLLDNAIEEMIRNDGPFMRVDRVAIEPVEIDGQIIAPEQRVILVLGAANRDPGKFHNPDLFDIDRENIDHLAFGHGEHFCLGARLARMDLSVSFEVLLRRLPSLQIVQPRVAWRQHFNHRGLRSMPFSLT